MTIKGIKKIASESKHLAVGCYLQVNYDVRTHEVWTNYLCGFGNNSWVEYHDENVINCGNIHHPMTMKEIKEMIECKVKEVQMYREVEA